MLRGRRCRCGPLEVAVLAGGVFATPLFVTSLRPVGIVRSTPQHNRRELSQMDLTLTGYSSHSGIATVALLLATAGVVHSRFSLSKVMLQAKKAKPGKKKKKKAYEAPPKDVEPPFDPAEQIGALPPLGFFDPLGFTAVGERGKFRRLREAELKHGRVAMLAAAGLVGQHFVRFPGFENVPNAANASSTDPANKGFLVLVLVAAYLELFGWAQDPKKEPGDFGDPLGLNMYTVDMRNKELNNGRFAMFSVMGILSAQLASGKDAVEQLLPAGTSIGYSSVSTGANTPETLSLGSLLTGAAKEAITQPPAGV